MHWHGMHLPASMDGGPYQVIKPEQTWVSSFPVKQLATTLWYHPHLMGKTGEQVYQGLAGMFILEDSVSKNLDIPKEYAYDDIPVIIQDRRFNEEGQLQYIESGHDIMMGMRGDRILVNGAMRAKLDAPAKLVRLRVLNASNARIYDLGFSDEREFYQIATDGGLVEKPVKLDGLRLAPGERTELLVDLSKDYKKTLDLVSFTRDRDGNRSSFPILRVDVTKEVAKKNLGKIPTKLTKIQWFEAQNANEQRSFRLTMGREGFRINNLEMDMKRIDHKIPLGNKEIWTISTNRMVHPFHVHDIQFQILSRGGKEPYIWENGWKDTVLIYPGEEVQVMMQFLDYADEKYPYMYHCHILEHEDKGMMGQFTVVP
jgi:bilirubin oxidase